MSEIHIRHIQNILEKTFKDLIDLSDHEKDSAEHQQNHFKTRALAAFSLVHLCEIDPSKAASTIIDGFEDNGIDAVYFDKDDRVLYLVQSKWDSTGKRFPDKGAIHSFIQGVKDLLHLKWKHFNKKLIPHQTSIESALHDVNITILLIIVHTGSQKISTHTEKLLNDFLKEINDTSEILKYKVLNQMDLHAAISKNAEGNPINVEVMLYDWGHVETPYLAYYGQIEVKDIAQWWQNHRNRLFNKNLRKLISKSDVNNTISQSLQQQPHHFWYLNNGVTALCSKISKKAIGSTNRNSGVFVCESLSVVNGAQTVGCIGTTLQRNPESVLAARVSIRLISLEGCPIDFAAEVTRATNTQNRIESRDFASLDPEQERLRTEILFDCEKEYTYKTGDSDPSPEKGFSITEATIALACNQFDPTLAVQAKREISKLWEDINKNPYKQLFNNKLTGLRLWRTVDILRSIDSELHNIASSEQDNRKMVTIHLNRLIAHLVFLRLPMDELEDSKFELSSNKDKAKELTQQLVSEVAQKVQELYPGAYLGSLFKNQAKCREICEAINKAK